MSSERTLKSMLADQFARRAAGTADHLRRLADEIEQAARNMERVPSIGCTSASAVAGDIVHKLMWGLANAHVDGVVSAAAEYDFHMNAEQTRIMVDAARAEVSDVQ